MVDFSMSLAFELEPLMGAGLALNLAYLYLDQFYWPQQIGVAAENARQKQSDAAGLEQSVAATLLDDEDNGNKNYVRHIKYLSSLGKEDKEDFALPLLTFWAWGLILLYVVKIDRKISLMWILFISVVLIVGVANKLELFPWAVSFFSSTNIWLFFWMAVISYIWPLLMVGIAWIIKRRVESYVILAIGSLALSSAKGAKSKFDGKPEVPDAEPRVTSTAN